jgi:hypothetical protein
MALFAERQLYLGPSYNSLQTFIGLLPDGDRAVLAYTNRTFTVPGRRFRPERTALRRPVQDHERRNQGFRGTSPPCAEVGQQLELPAQRGYLILFAWIVAEQLDAPISGIPVHLRRRERGPRRDRGFGRGTRSGTRTTD